MLSSFRRVARRLFSTTSDAHAALWDVQAAAPLIVDPYLPLLLEALPAPAWQPEAAAARAALADVMAVRSRAIDRWLETPSWPPVRTTRRQIVLLGGGLDTRAYRLGLGQSRAGVAFRVGDPRGVALEHDDEDVIEATSRFDAQRNHRRRGFGSAACGGHLRLEQAGDRGA